MLDIIAPASMLANDKHFSTHVEWIRNLSAKMHAEGNLERAWDGKVNGNPVNACIDSSRWVAFCPYCNGAEAVDPVEKVFFCFQCNMYLNNYQALPVEFPEPSLLAQIVGLLMERPMIQRGGPTRYERITRMIPAIHIDVQGQRFGLGRCWHHSQTVDELRAEQEEPIAAWMRERNGE